MLEKFPDDLGGLMLLAEIQAEDLRDLDSSRWTIERIVSCAQQNPGLAVDALSRLADWQVKFESDLPSARQTIERILTLFPNTRAAHLARQRLAHLGSTQQIEAAQDRTPIFLPHHEGYLGLRDDTASLVPKEEDPAITLQNLVDQIARFPHDNDARKLLAILYARHLRRLDLAEEQIRILAQQSHVSRLEIAEWLNLLADLYVKHARDQAAARRILEEIMARFPDTAAAENARRRLSLLALELRSNEPAPTLAFDPKKHRIFPKPT